MLEGQNPWHGSLQSVLPKISTANASLEGSFQPDSIVGDKSPLLHHPRTSLVQYQSGHRLFSIRTFEESSYSFTIISTQVEAQSLHLILQVFLSLTATLLRSKGETLIARRLMPHKKVSVMRAPIFPESLVHRLIPFIPSPRSPRGLPSSRALQSIAP